MDLATARSGAHRASHEPAEFPRGGNVVPVPRGGPEQLHLLLATFPEGHGVGEIMPSRAVWIQIGLGCFDGLLNTTRAIDLLRSKSSRIEVARGARSPLRNSADFLRRSSLAPDFARLRRPLPSFPDFLLVSQGP